MKVLNLYSGIGGNRKLWKDVDVTAVEINPDIAKVYLDFFPDDKVIVGDAHEYLINNFKNFDFIWSSPPCPTHSRVNTFLKGMDIYRYPDMKLYEEIIFLKHYFKGKWCIENVISYYEPLIKPFRSNSHYYWSNFVIPNLKDEIRNIIKADDRKCKTTQEGIEFMEKEFNIDLSNYNISNTLKEKILNNCVQPKMGKFILDCAFKTKQEKLINYQDNKK